MVGGSNPSWAGEREYMIQFIALAVILIFFTGFLIVLLGGLSFVVLSKYTAISPDAFVGILIVLAVVVSLGFAIWIT